MKSPAFAKASAGKQVMKYNPQKIEKKWQKRWLDEKVHKVSEETKKQKYYQLETFPYPSAAGLHVGHPKGYIAEDIHARFMRMKGYEVLYTMGWDAFGLPTENYAIKVGKSPQEVAKDNIKNFKKQLRMFGLSYDWDREINTSDPSYYKWTQWIFIQLFKKGLAYRAKAKVNWCPQDQTVLANEQVVDGKCDRCGSLTEQKEMEQWFLAITKYTEHLLEDLKGLDWPEATIKRQQDWIGESEGALIKFEIRNSKSEIEVFTTRPDTLFGATYMVLAPENPLLADGKLQIANRKEVEKYIETASHKTELMRQEDTKEKTGVELKGIKAINSATGEEIPIWVADYVLGSYGTGAIMAVPAHDERDFEFAKKFNLLIKEVVMPNIVDRKNPPVKGKKFVERENVHAIVRNPKTDKYLALKWKKFNWITFPMGGIEKGEDPISAAKREVLEETGFINLKLVKVLDGRVRAEYFAAHKDENRVAYTITVVFDLIDYEQKNINQKEKDDHEIIWLDRSKLNYENMTHAESDIWNLKLNGENIYTGSGILVNSGKFDGMDSEKAKEKIIEFVKGEKVTKYKLRDWSVSRQRYWGVPIPMIHCEKCGIVPISEKDLPIKLPKIEDYRPKGKPPLASSEKFINVKCPECGGPAKRDPETLDSFVDSSWYYLAYVAPEISNFNFQISNINYWMPVDLYVIGAEHTVLHLLYARFITKFLFDNGYLNFKEPFIKLRHLGLIRGADGQKMSKSKDNVINPDPLVEQWGADAIRLYEMFMGPFEDGQPWDPRGVVGTYRFLNKIWGLKLTNNESITNKRIQKLLHQTIKKITEDIQNFSFNTAISALMIFINEIDKNGIFKSQYETLLKILFPFAPHIAQELWESLGNENLLDYESWPTWDEKLVQDEDFELIIQVNGKLRGTVLAAKNISQKEAEELAQSQELVKKWLQGNIKKIIFVPNRLINFIVE